MMRLAMHTDYTLRVLTYLAVSHPQRATIEQIAGAYGISQNHLMKVVHRLGRSGEIETTRGRAGGLRLAHEPKDINIGTVVRGCEGPTALVECFGSGNACCITPACVLKTALAEANEAFFMVLDTYTLADLVRPHNALARLLSLADQTT